MKGYAKVTVAIILVIASLIGVFYITGAAKTGKVADITVFVEVQNKSVSITDIEGNLENVPKVSIPQGGSLVAPGISVILSQNMRPVSDWYSLPANGSAPTYNFRIGLYDSFSEDRPVFVYAQAVNSRSEELASVQKKLLLNKSVK